MPFSIVQVGLLLTTYVLDQKKSNWVCGPALLFLGCLSLLFQLTFTFAGWRSTFDKTGITITIISGLIFVFFILCFINFLTKCS